MENKQSTRIGIDHMQDNRFMEEVAHRLGEVPDARVMRRIDILEDRLHQLAQDNGECRGRVSEIIPHADKVGLEFRKDVLAAIEKWSNEKNWEMRNLKRNMALTMAGSVITALTLLGVILLKFLH